jgi:carbamoyl-phosphate synthase large subunit
MVAEICSREGVALVVPTIDPELLPLSLSRDLIARSGARVNVAAPAVVRIARDKLETTKVLAAAGLATPASALAGDAALGSGRLSFPVIAKPRDGSSSVGIRTISSQRDLEVLREHDGYVVQERPEGIEFTVNIFVDQAGRLRASVPHRRMDVRNGEVAKGRTERNVALKEMAERLVEALPGIQGVLCFQAFLTERGPVIFEINARFGGGYPLAHASGATFAQWLLEEALGLPLTATDDWRSGVQMLRYDSEVFR